jgi:PAS domain S-box-containing protein
VVTSRASVQRYEGEWNGEVESLLLDQIDAAVIALDLEEHVTHWNAHAVALYGWSQDEVLGRGIRTLGLARPGHPDGDAVVARLKSGRSWEGDMEMQRKDGTPFLAFVKDAPLHAPDGTMVGFVGVSVDVTERRRIETALRSRNAELLRAERIARLASWEWDIATGKVRYATHWDEPLLAQREGTGLRSELFEIGVHPDDKERVREAIGAALAAGRDYKIDFRMTRPDGEVRHVLSIGELQTDSAGTPITVYGTSQDVTEQREAEQALRASEQARRRLLAQVVTAHDDERRRLAADIHDYAIQELHAATLRAEGLTHRLDEPDQLEAAAALEATLRTAVRNLRNIVAGVRQPAFEGVELMPAVEAYLAEAVADWPVSYRVENRLAREPLPELRAVLFRIVVEAVSNARKHSDASTLTVSAESDEVGVRVEIADDGRGFVPGETDPASLTHYGLASMNERAEMVGGWFHVHTEPGAGTRVEAWVPDPGAGL